MERSADITDRSDKGFLSVAVGDFILKTGRSLWRGRDEAREFLVRKGERLFLNRASTELLVIAGHVFSQQRFNVFEDEAKGRGVGGVRDVVTDSILNEISARNLFQSITFALAEVDESTREAVLTFSNESRIDDERHPLAFSHNEGAVILSTLNNFAPLLLDHNPRSQIGVVLKAWVEGKSGFAKVRFSRSQLGHDVMLDVVDGIRRKVSCGATIRRAERGTVGDEVGIIATLWEPYEISFVSLPANRSVGL